MSARPTPPGRGSVTMQAPIVVEVLAPRIGRSSADIACEVVDEPGTVYLRARSRTVQLDIATHAARLRP